MAIALAEAGADICLVMREPPPGTQPNMSTADAIRALGRRVEIVHCDLADLPAVKGLFEKALAAMGGTIDILINCAGIQRRAPAVDFSEQDWDDVREVWVRGRIRVADAARRSSMSTSNRSGCSRSRRGGTWYRGAAERSSTSARS